MFKKIFPLFQLSILFSCGVTSELNSGKPPIRHIAWDKLLKVCVDHEGFVDYNCFLENRRSLDDYLLLLSDHFPDSELWSKEEKMAYWINAYNAFTVKLIIENYPVSSIKEIKSGLEIPFVNSIWDRAFIKLGGFDFCLNDIEHRILRKEFQDPRIHFALNCASISCPSLLDESYEAEKLESQLEARAFDFFNDPGKNRFEEGTFYASRIFLWYASDFGGSEGVRWYVKKYFKASLTDQFDLVYLEYDWGLNERKLP